MFEVRQWTIMNIEKIISMILPLLLSAVIWQFTSISDLKLELERVKEQAALARADLDKRLAILESKE